MVDTATIDKVSKEIARGIGGIDTKPFILGLLFLKAYRFSLWKELCLSKNHYETVNEFGWKYSEINWLSQCLNFNNDIWGKTQQEKHERINKILNLFDEIDLSDEHDLGDTYQYLLALFANNAGRYGGEYYSPRSVSLLLSKLALINAPEKISKIYDPTCGTSSALLTLYKECKALGHDPEVHGQELNKTTWHMALANCLLHNVKYNIALGDTLSKPAHKENKYDLIISNPPFSCDWEQDPTDIRFCDYPLAPRTCSDFAFWLHCLHLLKNDGVIALVAFPGVLYRGGKEKQIREKLVEQNLIDCIIQLPENLFTNTAVSTAVVILRKNKTTKDILFINASKLFIKEKKKSDMTKEHIDLIIETYKKRESKEYFSTLVNNENIEDTLSVSTYVEKEDTREKIDIDVLNKEISQIVKNTNRLRKGIDEIIGLCEEEE